MKTVADLKIGEIGIIKNFADKNMALKLQEMGCLTNAEVRLTYIAPMGDPICIQVAGYQLSMRKSEAATMIIK
ncbi:MAG: ferrous iron transport protein A [Bacteroidetes bacterium]|nr:MAG: ferrous iron transport protein A [Bacteroidota bacterium]